VKISIITVCFNSEATIELCLNSVASQSWANVEHIIVDGCSTDSTLQLIEENRQGNMVVVSEPDNGIYDAMNKGLSLATGDYVAYLNSDDLYTLKLAGMRTSMKKPSVVSLRQCDNLKLLVARGNTLGSTTSPLQQSEFVRSYRCVDGHIATA